VMIWILVVAVATGMLGIVGQTMGPRTVVEGDTVAAKGGFVGMRTIRSSRRRWDDSGSGRRFRCDLIGAVIPHDGGSQFAMALFFMLGEMRHKIGPCMFGLVLVIPRSDGMV
jgi:hypothetical protein